MTVAELIAELGKYPPDMTVVTPIDTGDYETVFEACIEERFTRDGGRFFDEYTAEYLSLTDEVRAVKVVQVS
jgi:hypothetical protein